MSKPRTTSGDSVPHQELPAGNLFKNLTTFPYLFKRFGRDAVGVLLLAFAVMALLAYWNITQGALLTPIAGFFSIAFGWGFYLLVFAVGYGGIFLLRRKSTDFRWSRFFALELAALLSLGLLSLIGGNDLTRVGQGMDGGYIGWGLTALAGLLAGELWGAILLIFIWLLSVFIGVGAWGYLEKGLHRLAGTTEDASLVVKPVVVDHKTASLSASGQAQNPVGALQKIHEPKVTGKQADKLSVRKKPAALPPEFRTALRSPQEKIDRYARASARPETLPSLDLLVAETVVKTDERSINQTAGLIMKTLSEFGIPATVIGYRTGPAVTQFAIQPGFIKKPGVEEEDAQQMKVRVAQIASLEKDLALALSAERLRIEAPVPGKPYVGIEVPNTHSTIVRLKPLLESASFNKVNSALAIALGRDVSGQPLIADLARMPHLLIAGATGTGKSICITSMAACLAMNNSPADLRMVMIDSKMVELLRFNGLPHLYGKVETRLDRILGVLRWIVHEMEHRYRMLEESHSRDIEAYNRKVSRRLDGSVLPRIVVLIDELADLMMSAPDQTEHNLVRLAQMARATGIHLVVATQRPSTDVVTGLIKANFPARLAFAVSSGVDSRVILDMNGAETLLGRGDLLFQNPEVGNPVRAQGVMVADMEIERIVSHWQKTIPVPLEETPPWERLLQESEPGDDDELIRLAVDLVRTTRHASASLVQRRLRIGYPRAARLLDQLEDMGVVGPSPGGGREREVLPFEEDEAED